MFIIVHIVAILWLGASIAIARKILGGWKGVKFIKGFSVVVAVFMVPLIPDFYAWYGFQAYCHVYGGFTKLEPVDAEVIAIERFKFGVFSPLLHPSIFQVNKYNLESGVETPDIAKSDDPKACLNEYHKKITEKYSKPMELEDFCFVNANRNFEAEYYVTTLSDKQNYTGQSAFYFADVKQDIFQVRQISSNEVISEFRWLNTDTVGFFTRILVPYHHGYQCEYSPNLQSPLESKVTAAQVYFIQNAVK